MSTSEELRPALTHEHTCAHTPDHVSQETPTGWDNLATALGHSVPQLTSPRSPNMESGGLGSCCPLITFRMSCFLGLAGSGSPEKGLKVPRPRGERPSEGGVLSQARITHSHPCVLGQGSQHASGARLVPQARPAGSHQNPCPRGGDGPTGSHDFSATMAHYRRSPVFPHPRCGQGGSQVSSRTRCEREGGPGTQQMAEEQAKQKVPRHLFQQAVT